MWPLLLTSIVALAVILERCLFLIQEKRNRDEQTVVALLSSVECGKPAEGIEAARSSGSPIARILSYGLQHRDISLSNALLHAANIELRRYNRGLAVLDTIITLSPLLGLLGTITGMISAFGLLGSTELGTPLAITGGIAEALIATAFGLGIAICSLLPFNYLNARLEEARLEIQDRTTQLELLLLEPATGRQAKRVANREAA
jgi:biopolymer transport protein ExbB